MDNQGTSPCCHFRGHASCQPLGSWRSCCQYVGCPTHNRKQQQDSTVAGEIGPPCIPYSAPGTKHLPCSAQGTKIASYSSECQYNLSFTLKGQQTGTCLPWECHDSRVFQSLVKQVLPVFSKPGLSNFSMAGKHMQYEQPTPRSLPD